MIKHSLNTEIKMREEWINVSGKKSEIIEKLQEAGLNQQSSEKLLSLLTKEKI